SARRLLWPEVLPPVPLSVLQSPVRGVRFDISQLLIHRPRKGPSTPHADVRRFYEPCLSSSRYEILRRLPLCCTRPIRRPYRPYSSSNVVKHVIHPCPSILTDTCNRRLSEIRPGLQYHSTNSAQERDKEPAPPNNQNLSIRISHRGNLF